MKAINYFKLTASTVAAAIGYNLIYIILSLFYRIIFEGTDTALGIESRGERIFYLLVLIFILVCSFVIFGVFVPRLSGELAGHTKCTTLAVFIISLVTHLLSLVIYYHPVSLINLIVIEYTDYFIISILLITVISNTLGVLLGCKRISKG